MITINRLPDETNQVKKMKTNVKKKTHFTLSILFGLQKMEEVKIRHVPSYYEKNQLHSLASNELAFFYETHIKQISGPPKTSRINE